MSGDTVLDRLKSVVSQLDDGCKPGASPCDPPYGCCPPGCPPCGPGCPPCGPCCPPTGMCCPPPCPFPYAQICMLTPPDCPVPTKPQYVKPLTLPTPPCPTPKRKSDPEREFQMRISNFYNNYNVDYRIQGKLVEMPKRKHHSSKKLCVGVTVDGKRPTCDDYCKMDDDDACSRGCPTGFKPCGMKLCPPPGCHPLGTWTAEIQPCPPKNFPVSKHYVPGPCTRPCCKHWKPKGGPCLYDKPCKAHCFNHPPGIKPSGRSAQC